MSRNIKDQLIKQQEEEIAFHEKQLREKRASLKFLQGIRYDDEGLGKFLFDNSSEKNVPTESLESLKKTLRLVKEGKIPEGASPGEKSPKHLTVLDVAINPAGTSTVTKDRKSASVGGRSKSPEETTALAAGHSNQSQLATEAGGGNGQQHQKLAKLTKELDDANRKLAVRTNELAEKDEQINVLQTQVTQTRETLRSKEDTFRSIEEQSNSNVHENLRLRDDLNRANNAFEKLQNKLGMIENDVRNLKKERDDAYEERNSLKVGALQLQKDRDKLDRHFRETKEKLEGDKRALTAQLESLTKERDDLRDRFSKLAGDKLTSNNADIADLSDPNRAMKLSEKFGQLYDDEWTDAFQELTDKIKMKPNDAIEFLLKMLQDCNGFCQTLADGQMASLRNVLLYPGDQDPSKSVLPPSERPRIPSREDRSLRELRKQVGTLLTPEIKQRFLRDVRKRHQPEQQKQQQQQQKVYGAAEPYLAKCTEICWLMVLHDPVPYMDMSVKSGDKLDSTKYSPYSSSGKHIEFLVWPPLYNGKDGGLLSKGVAATQRIVSKK